MESPNRIEHALVHALAAAEARGAPPKLAAALRQAVFPGGARIRPLLCVAVARACGDDDPALCDAAAAAIELVRVHGLARRTAGVLRGARHGGT